MLNKIKDKGTDSLKLDPRISIFLNPYSYLLLRKRDDILSQIDDIYIDGEWLCKFLRFMGVKYLERRSFDNSSLAPFVFKTAAEKEMDLVIIGSDEESISKFIKYLNLNYSNINISYHRNGYFDDDLSLDRVVERVAGLNPDILVVGMGVIKQEEFLIKVKKKNWNGVGYTCGGFIHQTAKKGHNYYPPIVDALNLRFLYRIFDEPKLFRRYTIDYMKFVFFIIYDRINTKL